METTRARIIEATRTILDASASIAAERSAKTATITAGTIKLLHANAAMLSALSDADDITVIETGITASLSAIAVLLNKLFAVVVAETSPGDLATLFDAIKAQKDRPSE
jgi:phosphoglycerate-specific signal transduction histidine kinase